MCECGPPGGGFGCGSVGMIYSKKLIRLQTPALNLRYLRTSAGHLGSGLRGVFVEQGRR